MSAISDARAGSVPFSLEQQSPRYGEKATMFVLWLCGAISILTTVGIVFVLFSEAIPFFLEDQINLWDFLTGTSWRPNLSATSDRFAVGVLPLVTGTLMVTLVAVVVAVPLGLATAIYLSDYAPRRVRRMIKPVLEVLAGVPTVVLGYFALTFFTPVLRSILGTETVGIFNAFSAGAIVGVMIVPTIASLSEDAMSAVPRSLREAAYGLGAPKRLVVRRVVVPAALSGIVSATILAFGRAIGETMIVAIASGNNPRLSFNPFEGMQTMTAYIVQTIGGEATRGSLAYESIFAVGALLFLITFSLNLLAHRISRRYRETY